MSVLSAATTISSIQKSAITGPVTAKVDLAIIYQCLKTNNPEHNLFFTLTRLKEDAEFYRAYLEVLHHITTSELSIWNHINGAFATAAQTYAVEHEPYDDKTILIASTITMRSFKPKFVKIIRDAIPALLNLYHDPEQGGARRTQQSINSHIDRLLGGSYGPLDFATNWCHSDREIPMAGFAQPVRIRDFEGKAFWDLQRLCFWSSDDCLGQILHIACNNSPAFAAMFPEPPHECTTVAMMVMVILVVNYELYQIRNGRILTEMKADTLRSSYNRITREITQLIHNPDPHTANRFRTLREMAAQQYANYLPFDPEVALAQMVV
ncbi:hypothetical protein BV25DRAFT_1921850 [Artomyces pyxidatus]|uniref:Uncharacterized protein n=1 Tax=Artomyces pyxidatus TaxID=48021 RepID=A0ACB8SFT2_9AGAM|nr:hypothetical protein BV25DRAFT_1921850 [Artomyces pyxidatus]